MMKVIPLNKTYRGFEIGYCVGHKQWFTACWQSSLNPEWRISSVYVDSLEEVQRLAQECIDYQYRVEVAEAELGRRLTMNELRPDL